MTLLREMLRYVYYTGVAVFYTCLAWLWRSPLGPLLARFRRPPSLDALTADLQALRDSLDDCDDPVERAHWESELEQWEWEHVRRLERAGRGDDPFVLWKTGGAGSTFQDSSMPRC